MMIGREIIGFETKTNLWVYHENVIKEIYYEKNKLILLVNIYNFMQFYGFNGKS